MEQTKIPEEQINNRPVWKTRIGTCQATIWENQRNIDGKTVTIRELSFARRYRTEDGEYKNTTKYSVNDIPKAILALQKAYEELTTPEQAT